MGRRAGRTATALETDFFESIRRHLIGADHPPRPTAARALVSGRTRAIGVVSLGTALYGPSRLLIGIERAARDAGYAVRVANTIEGDPSGIAGAVQSLLEQGVGGIAISEPIDEGEVTLTVNVPVLVIGAPAPFAAPRVVTVGQVASMAPQAAASSHPELLVPALYVVDNGGLSLGPWDVRVLVTWH